MSKAISFVGLDIRSLKPYSKSLLLIIIMCFGMGVGFKSVNTLTSYFMMSLTLIISYPFSISETNGLETLYSTLALNRRTVVVGRYLFVLVLELISAALAVIGSWALSLQINAEFEIYEILVTLSMLSGVVSIIVAVQFPIYFKYGYRKARMLALAPLGVLALVGMQLPNLAELLNLTFSWDSFFETLMSSNVMIIAPVIFGLLLMALSCILSCGIYAKRDI